jgi:organic hydroperoxide reductase OsmC/OhrA
MYDLVIRLRRGPGALAELGEALGRTGVSVEGGGGFVVDGQAVVHFLFADGEAARQALEAAGIAVLAVKEVVAVRLRQDQPGQLGALARAMADAGVDLEVVYSDHDHRLIVVPDDLPRARAVAAGWDGPPAGPTRIFDATVSPIPGSAPPWFRGDAARWNPEQLVVAALSACHQLVYLRQCAEHGVIVTAYEDAASCVVVEGPSARILACTLHPRVTLAPGSDAALALRLHALDCTIGRSVGFPVTCEPKVTA